MSRKFTLTDEQQAIVTEITKTYDDKPNIIKVEARAGSSKSTTAIECIKAVGGKILYLVFSKAMQLEMLDSIKGTGTHPDIRTIHSFAYGYAVSKNNRLEQHKHIKVKPKVGFLNARDMKDIKDYAERYAVLNHMEAYFASEYTSVERYCASLDIEPTETVQVYLELYTERMFTNKVPMTHSGYLKYFHLLLAEGAITDMPDFDMVCIDEFQDVAAVTLEIATHLNSHRFLFVGDEYQAIFKSFTGAVNGFNYFRDTGVTLELSQSFRVNTSLASRIEAFGRQFMTPHFNFRGFDYEDSTVNTHMYIARTNGALIAKMVDLIEHNIPFSMPRDPSRIFALPLTLIFLNSSNSIHDAQYKFLEKDVQKYDRTPKLQKIYSSSRAYIKAKYEDDIEIQSALKLIPRFSSDTIVNTSKKAKAYYTSGKTYQTSVCTAHSSKGLTVDAVTLLPDMNTMMQEAFAAESEVEPHMQLECAELYYVSCTRCRHQLYNAEYITS